MKRWITLLTVLALAVTAICAWWWHARPEESYSYYRRININMPRESVAATFGRHPDWDVTRAGGTVHPSQPAPANVVGWLFDREDGTDLLIVGFDEHDRVVGKEIRSGKYHISEPPMWRMKIEPAASLKARK